MDEVENVQMETNLKRLSETADEVVEPDKKKYKVDLSNASCLDGSKEESEKTKYSTNKGELDAKQHTPTISCDVQASEPVLSEYELGRRLTEVDVGVTEYLGAHGKTFTAIIKQRYSDFIVNEIDADGNIVHLKKVTHDDKDDEDKVVEENETNDEETNILSDDHKMAIQKIVTERNKDASHDIMAPDDKDLRTKIHLAVKQSFPQLETKTTEDKEGNKVIRVLWRKGKSRDTNRDEWPKSKKSCRYVRFVLYKENKDTMDAIGLISKNIKVRESMFQYAGTKDKRAKTTQEITAHRIHPKKLVGLNKVLWNMALGDFRYVEQPLQLGQLSGNHFVIALRNVQGSQEVVDSAFTSLKDIGFINYFGMQRFGTTSIPTHRIGSALLKGDWAKAIDLILSPRNDVSAKDKFQKMWARTKDPAATLDVTPRYCGLERNLLEALKKSKPFNALEKLPRNTRLLYLHSYQSLVWNKMASKRLAQLGHCVIPGDLVMDKGGCKDGQGSSNPIVVTKENTKDYSLTDVVLPLPGYDVVYPQNHVGDWYREILTEDGMDIDNMKRSQKDYSLSGAYRPLVIIPKDVTWTHHHYDDYTQPLTLSDFDVIQGDTLNERDEKGGLSAVVLRISLPSSCYATMALREAMRVDTSSFHQASLNVSS